jgi:thiamine-monophosphate kinase
MKINEFGGEFALIEQLAKLAPTRHSDLATGIGDDAAVIRHTSSDGDLILVTTDMLVEASHFNREWSTPEQIGIKSVACNVSDIAAMGGTPAFMFVSLALPPSTEVIWVQSLYQGMADACRRYGMVLAGGDTTHGKDVTISITLLGKVSADSLCLRSHAQPGDVLAVTGHLGASAAGLAMLVAGLNPPSYLRDKHVAPGCRLDVSSAIAPLAHAMIDISDGLAAEVNHICDQSGTGALIYAADIPIHQTVKDAAVQTGNDALGFALSGGEDFELLFSIPASNTPRLDELGIDVTVVGRITQAKSGRFLEFPDGTRKPLTGGYNHFA